jgi:hypothetical protein
MSFTDEELDLHCSYILHQRRIRNKITILCEGGRYEGEQRLSPQMYGRMESFPDADFYAACVPHYWRERKPEFFNCGDRTDTLNTYFRLQELHAYHPEKSYLSPDLLFAIVDIDLNTAKLDDKEYGFADTEAIFHDLYQDLKIQPDKLSEHRIWVTGLTHKEAYFLNPDLQHIFDEYPIAIEYQRQKIDLNAIYRDMAKGLAEDSDLRQHFTRVVKRICHCSDLDVQDINSLSLCLQGFCNGVEQCETSSIFALLAIAKSKPYWKKLEPAHHHDNLSLQIAKEFYARQDNDRCLQYHLPYFFKYLHGMYHNLST